jgi:YegS/Rv2252/BmrU family lipid kinase
MKRVFIIFNPSARGEKSQRLRHFLESKAGKNVALAPTRCAGDATRLAAEGAADGYDVIVAAGGDGTINEVVNGIRPTGTTLGVIPLGTVNVFARELGIPLKLERAWRVLEEGSVRTVDLGVADFVGQRRYFVQLAGIGLDARAVRNVIWKLKKQIGPLSYVWAALCAIGEQKAVVEVHTSEGGLVGKGAMVLVGNGRLYGGSFRMFPEAKMDDGLLDICLFERPGYWHALRHGFGILTASHTKLSGVQYMRSAHFSCRAASLTPVELDGEDAGNTAVEFRLAPKALRVLAP